MRVSLPGAILSGAIALSGASLAAADRPALIEAAKNADRQAVRTLLKQGANANATEADGTTALHWAAYRDDLETTDALIRAGAKVNAANDLGATPLWNASSNGSAPVVKRLLDAGANPNLKLLLGETPLMVGARTGNAAVVEQLLAKGADINARAARGQTALMWAVAQQHPAVVKVLIAHKADIHARSAVWSQMMAVPPHGMRQYNREIPHGGDTALLFAARVGDLESARLLVDAGANVNDADAWGVTGTMLAAHSGFAEVLDLLLERGADPNLAEPGFTPLHAAIMRRHEGMVSALLAHGADANAPLRTWTPTRRSSADFNFAPELVGATPFWLASRWAEPGIMRQLLKYGADPKVVHRADYHAGDPAEPRSQVTTALLAATGMGGGIAWVRPARAEQESRMLEAVKIVADLGVDVNAANTDGRTALDAVQALKYSSIAAFLTERGGKPGANKKPNVPTAINR